ncbi:efflux RND transporter permease subunit [Azospirillum melinis]|uniref:efflux RND transporter permease subunit n=1 Tax=Azospirillum melinis TaxID=328839 RepID=UPI0031B60D9B|nr:hypothetical protein [Azospirillum melinis]
MCREQNVGQRGNLPRAQFDQALADRDAATIEEIVLTLGITFLLVVVVIHVFHQDWRATLILTLAIPVSIIGVFAVLLVLGYSANIITLFALILTIGLVVGDAIVVVENVRRVMEEHLELSAPEASAQAMGQASGAIVAATLLLAAVDWHHRVQRHGGGDGDRHRLRAVLFVAFQRLTERLRGHPRAASIRPATES